jgi:N-acetyl-gamma-glutamyl-phosphate reductase
MAHLRTRVAVIGASGYTGAELLRLLTQHPRVVVTALCAKERVAPTVTDVLPSMHGVLDLPITLFDPDHVASVADVAFCALPHGASIEAVKALHNRGVKVFDLSADFRLRDPATYAHWYGAAHSAQELLPSAVYGLCELNREALVGATLVAVPGCYPTASALALLPLYAAGILQTEVSPVIHALSGVSGAGRTPSASSHFSETAEGARLYKIAGTHRHTPEIEQTLSQTAGAQVTVTFTPTLAPMTRGILSTCYVQPKAAVAVQDLEDAARRYFARSPSVCVLPAGRLPDTLWVRGSNRAHLGYAVDARANRVITSCAIDNLVKGASGQAIQCMNIALGFDEDEGLRSAALWP